MRTAMILMSLVGTTISWAGDRSLTVCLPWDPQVDATTLTLAQGYASRIYHAVGLNLRWKSSCTAAELDAPGTSAAPNLLTLGIQWEAKAPAEISRTARALAYPFRPTGTRITLYQDRIFPILQREMNFGASVLGHILAHEIGHVLLGCNSHAHEGLMKSTWCALEERDMRRQLLRFTDDHAVQIRRNLEVRPLVLAEDQQAHANGE